MEQDNMTKEEILKATNKLFEEVKQVKWWQFFKRQKLYKQLVRLEREFELSKLN